MTIDSFAWRLLRRWRSLGRTLFEPADPSDFALVCNQAGQLLSREAVARWFGHQYPYIVVDEMQDSRGAQLTILQHLAGIATCLAAADDFQDLSGETDNPAVGWAREICDPIVLSEIHRTDLAGLLAASSALRNGVNVATGAGFRLQGVPAVGLAAWHVAQAIRTRNGSLAVLTPVRPESSAFVRDVVARVEEKPIGKNPIGPYRCKWERASEAESRLLVESLKLPADPNQLFDAADLQLPDGNRLSAGLRSHFGHRRRICGKQRFTATEVETAVSQIAHRTRAYSNVAASGVAAMTIHQAKNREFDKVVVLWPYQASGSPERLRRILYNAVTRAKKSALVIVQNPKRLFKPPFVGNEK